jgi:S1-C subfamily serine protease
MPLNTSLKFSLKFGLRLMLVSVMLLLVAVTVVRQEFYKSLEHRLDGYEADSLISGMRVQRSLAEAAQEDVRARGALSEKLAEIEGLQQQVRDSVGRASFAADTVTSSLVEIICVDNADDEKYYTGSGAVIDKSGLIVTNQHVLISSDGTLMRVCGIGMTGDVSLPPKMKYLGRLAATDTDLDLALIKISESLDGSETPDEFSFIDLAGTGELAAGLRIGDPVFIVGYPGVGAETLTLTQGVVAGRVGSHLIKTSAFIDSGASGGGVFNAEGRYVGVPMAAARGDIGGSLGYLIGADAVDGFLRDFRAGKNLVTGVRIE